MRHLIAVAVTLRHNTTGNATARIAAVIGTSKVSMTAAQQPARLNDDFVAASKAANAQAMLTIPTIGWVAKSGAKSGEVLQLLNHKVWPTKGERLAMVSRRGQRSQGVRQSVCHW